MGKAERLRRAIRTKLEEKALIVMPGVHDALVSKIAEKVGFEALYVSGMATANAMLGVPDLGLVSLFEMVTNLKNICNAVDLPVVADMDTGYGNAIGVMRSVKEYEKAGAAGFHVEDMFGVNKPCGHILAKDLISTEEMEGKIRACVEAREDENMIIIGRSDARPILGSEAARKRARAYAEAGADVVFLAGPATMEEIRDDVKAIDAPLLLDMETGALSVREIEQLGYGMVIFPDVAVHSVLKAVTEAMRHLKDKGTLRGWEEHMVTFEQACEAVDISRFRTSEEEFLSREESPR